MKQVWRAAVLAAVAGAAVLAPQGVGASSDFVIAGKSYVLGHLGHRLAADITVNCHGVVKTTTAHTDGEYSVTFTYAECPVGSLATVTLSYPPLNLHGTNTGIVQAWPATNIDVQGGPTTDVPEYGWLGGLLALSAGAGALAFTRRPKRASVLARREVSK